MTTLLLLLLLPVLAAVLAPLVRKSAALSLCLAAAIGAANLVLAVLTFSGGLACTLPIELHGFEFVFDAGPSALFLLLAAALFLPAALYAAAFFLKRPGGGLFMACLYLSLFMINGALLAGHLGLMLLFWEGLLVTLFGMLVCGNFENPRALSKGFALSGASDLILMLGVAAVSHAAHTGVLKDMSGLPATGLGALGAACLLLGALGKTAAIPFHDSIPDAAEDAPAPFAAAFPGALYTVLGGYLTLQTASKVFDLPAAPALRILLTALGLVTLLGGAGMALKQANPRRAIACLGIAQAGLLALGLGAGTNAGYAGAALQVCAGALGISGLHMAMGGKRPAAAIFALICAASLAGFPLLGGFYASVSTLASLATLPMLLALCGLLLNALALCRLLHSAFFSSDADEADEGIPGLPAALAAAALLLAAVFHRPLLASPGLEKDILGFVKAPGMAAALWGTLLLAGLIHALSARGGGPEAAAGLLARLPLLKQLYALQSRGALDPYRWLTGFMGGIAFVSRKLEDVISWVYDGAIPAVARLFGNRLSRFDNGSLSRYLALALAGMLAVGAIFLIVLL